MKRKLTAYQKNLNRLFRQMNRMERRFYDFDEGTREQLKQMSARQLGQIKTKWLYKHSHYYDLETGEIMTGGEAHQLELKRKAEKSAETRRKRNRPDFQDTAFGNFELDFETWLNAPAETTMERVVKGGKIKRVTRNPKAVQAEENAKSILGRLYEQVKKDDPRGLAIRLDENSPVTHDLIVRVMPGSNEDEIKSATETLGRIIKGSDMNMLERTNLGDEEDEDFNNGMYEV